MNPARVVFPVIRWGDRSLEAVWPEVRNAVELGVGGFVVFGGSVSRMAKLASRVNEHAGRPLLFAADLERGAGQQFSEATPLPPAAALAGLDDAALIEAARMTAQEAAAAGIGWVLGPVADLDIEPANPIVGTRSFGAGALSVADQVRAWVMTLQGEGVHACAKHFPGHGRTTADSHAELPVVSAPRDELEADLTPFRAAVDVGVRSIMMAHVAYPAIDPSGRPASLSYATVGLLRRRLGFGGLVVTDAMIMEAVSALDYTPAEASVEAIRVGCDVVLYPPSPEATVVALSEALSAGTLAEERVASAIRRIDAAASSAVAAPDDLVPTPSHAQALDMAAATVCQLRGAMPELHPGDRARVHVVDDDRAGPSARGAAPGAVVSDRGAFADALAQRGIEILDQEDRREAAELIATFAEIRGWKGRAGLAPSTEAELERLLDGALDATLVLFGHPRLAEGLPSAARVVCGWNGDPLMQEAVAQRLVRSVDE
jgi:beta-glucosidase-like glycosyl hydrolase